MSRTWYPEINYERCTDCGACIEKCSHDVYDKSQQHPVVINTMGCITDCRGCQELCPVQAISYVGDIFKDYVPGCCG